jgi:hypothetical protein
MSGQSISTDLFDAVNARLSKITAIANLLMDVDPTGMAKGGLSDTAWVIVDLAAEAHDLITGKIEVQS